MSGEQAVVRMTPRDTRAGTKRTELGCSDPPETMSASSGCFSRSTASAKRRAGDPALGLLSGLQIGLTNPTAQSAEDLTHHPFLGRRLELSRFHAQMGLSL